MAIIMIGVGFYAGIRQSTPAIRAVENDFVREYNMMDLHIISTLGLTDDDLKEIYKLDSVDSATGGYSEYVYSGDNVLHVLSMDEVINKYKLFSGERPWRDNECLADKNHYKVGDVIEIKEPGDEDNIVIDRFVVTGTIISPIYMGDDLGSAPIGGGELYSYIVVKKAAFNMEAYTDIYVTTRKGEEDVPYSDSYDEKLDQLSRQIKSITTRREKAREKELYDEAADIAYQEVEDKRGQVESQIRTEIEEAVREEMEAAQQAKKAELMEKAGKLGITFENFVGKLSDTVTALLNPITDSQVSEAAAEQVGPAVEKAMEEAHAKALEEIDIPECKWFVQDRNDVVSLYKSLVDMFAEVETIADVIPIFFIVVVILMTSNTMSRMISEERGEMGTFTSLGISNIAIIGGYMIYVLMATILGVVSGYFIGVLLLPDFVYSCFGISMADISFAFDGKMFLGSLIVAFVVMTGVTIFSCVKELWAKPAYLLRPVPPKAGRKILLERIKPLWGIISFSWKITIRNMVRYKRRVIMTIIGVGGCTFLIWIGLALRDSTGRIGDVQFDDLVHYDSLVILEDGVKSFDSIDTKNSDEEKVKLSELVEAPLMMKQESLKVENSVKYSLDVLLFVPDEDSDMFEKYFTFRAADPRDVKVEYQDGHVLSKDELPEKGSIMTLSEDGVLITPRIADIMDVGPGDTLQMTDADGKIYEAKVDGIIENYVGNYVYMSETLYRKVFRSGVMYNCFVSGLASGEDIVDKILEIEDIVSVNTRDYMLRKANETIKGLDMIVVLLVVIASLLSFTVLYNLTAISISERTREIATLKVLGFTYTEANDYIYRETIISSIVGIGLGLIICPYMHGLVLDVLEVDNMVFLRETETLSYVFAGLLAFIFTLVMALVTFVRLSRVDMIESLKSVD
ncbi:MAG: hypothetical protein K6E10_07195 [Eubacterium sp.]|nr:hypothetical protein [Eubacterium sp.]